MNTQSLQQALSEDELDRLTDFLDALGSSAMNIEMLDGYFVALICGPHMVMPSEYLPHIFGDFSFDSEAQATDIMGLMMRHWNTIVSVLANTLKKHDVYLPVLLQDDNGIAHGNDWAQGFMRGVHTRQGSWHELINNDDYGGSLLTIMLLAHEQDPDPAMRPSPVSDEKRENLLHMMVASIPTIYRFFEPMRHSLAHTSLHAPLRREGPKVGRNEPCPCGSGRKYKYCCATDAPTLH